MPVDALGADGKTSLDSGKVSVIDNQVDQTTGTVKLKAEFPNTNLQLWPGQFVNVRVLIDTLRQVVVVPTAAIQRGPNGTFVYVHQGRQHGYGAARHAHPAGRRAPVVASGLQAGEQVVTTGFARLTEGTPVAVSERRGRGPGQRPPGSARARRRARQARRRDKGEAQSERGRPAEPLIHERLFAVHPPPDRDLAARRCGHARRPARISLAAGLFAAAGRFPHHPGHHPAAGRQPRRDGVAGDGAARAQFRADTRARS